jgi:putative redox protein
MHDTHRSVSLERRELGGYVIRNQRGGELVVGTAEGSRFTPIELLLGAIAACGAIDLDLITSKRAEPESLTAVVEGHKIRDELGTRMTDLVVTYDARFPQGEAGDAARAVVPRTIEQIGSRLCTVSRTVQVATPVQTLAI